MTITQWHVPVDDETLLLVLDVHQLRRAGRQGADARAAAEGTPPARLRAAQERAQQLRLRPGRAGGGRPIPAWGSTSTCTTSGRSRAWGAIQDRTEEHLGKTDVAIIRYRRMLRAAIAALGEGDEAASADARRRRPGAVSTGPLSNDTICDRRRLATGLRRRAMPRAAPPAPLGCDDRLTPAGRRASGARMRGPTVTSRDDDRLSNGQLARLGLADAGRPRPRASCWPGCATTGSRPSGCCSPISTACCAARRWWPTRCASALADGITVPSTLLLKDTSHRTVFPVWSEDGRHRRGPMRGAGDILLVPDPATFRRLPWAPHSAWLLCDVALRQRRADPLRPAHRAAPRGRPAGRGRAGDGRRARGRVPRLRTRRRRRSTTPTPPCRRARRPPARWRRATSS